MGLSRKSFFPVCRSRPGLLVMCQPQTNAQALEMDFSVCNPGAKLSAGTGTALTGLLLADSAHPLTQSTRAINVTFAPDEIALIAVGSPYPVAQVPGQAGGRSGSWRGPPRPGEPRTPSRHFWGREPFPSHPPLPLLVLEKPPPPGRYQEGGRSGPIAAPPQPMSERSYWLKPPGV